MTMRKLTTEQRPRQASGSFGKKEVVRRTERTKLLRAFPLGQGIPSLERAKEEVDHMRSVLMGHLPPPKEVGNGVDALLEVADAYFARACDITMEIQRAEQEGVIGRGSNLYKFRTGELRTFTEMVKAAASLGSRRISAAQLRFEQELRGRESV